MANDTTGNARQGKRKPGRNNTRSPRPSGGGLRVSSALPHGRKPNGSANPKGNFERYMALAKSAASSGDVIEAENYYQHAEHYFRMMNGTANETA